MSHKLHRLLESIYNTPHLITPTALKPLVEYLQERNSPTFEFARETAQEPPSPEVVGTVGEIKVSGAISYQPVHGICGTTGASYTGILEQAEELIGQGVKTIIMTYSSPGGSAAHCFSTCEELRSLADENGVRIISYVDEQAASAALALSVIADEVVIHPSASTGSVGCVCCVVDQSKALENAGIRPIYVASTPGKTAFDNNGAFSKEFLDSLQEDVTRLGNQFAAHVSKFTGISVDEILAMDAKMFHAERALEVGLVNKIMDHRQFAAYIAQTQGKE